MGIAECTAERLNGATFAGASPKTDARDSVHFALGSQSGELDSEGCGGSGGSCCKGSILNLVCRCRCPETKTARYGKGSGMGMPGTTCRGGQVAASGIAMTASICTNRPSSSRSVRVARCHLKLTSMKSWHGYGLKLRTRRRKALTPCEGNGVMIVGEVN